MGREVLRDEFLHVWELSTFHPLQFLISSYGHKISSKLCFLTFNFFQKYYGFFGSSFSFSSLFFRNLLKSWYIRRKVEKRLSDSYSLFEFWSPFFRFPTLFVQRSMKIIFLGRGVLRDEFLHVWELSIFHPLQLSISSYDLKMSS